MTILNVVESTNKLTLAMNKREKFAYVNIPKSSIVALNKNSENPFPSHFAKSVLNSLKNSDKNMMKAISNSLVPYIESGKHFKIGLNKNSEYYYSNIFEYYLLNNKEVYDTIINYFIRNTSKIVISFHDKKIVQRVFGFDSHVINVPFHNYYDKLDNIYSQISEFNEGVEYCIFDCGVLGLALASKIWENLDMSIVDTGKIVSLTKAMAQQN